MLQIDKNSEKWKIHFYWIFSIENISRFWTYTKISNLKRKMKVSTFGEFCINKDQNVKFEDHKMTTFPSI